MESMPTFSSLKSGLQKEYISQPILTGQLINLLKMQTELPSNTPYKNGSDLTKSKPDEKPLDTKRYPYPLRDRNDSLPVRFDQADPAFITGLLARHMRFLTQRH